MFRANYKPDVSGHVSGQLQACIQIFFTLIDTFVSSYYWSNWVIISKNDSLWIIQ